MSGTYTLLNAINFVLARVGVIQGVTGYLTSLTDSGKQIDIDVAKQCWNETIQDLAVESPLIPGLSDQGTIALVSGNKEYAPPVGQTQGAAIEVVKWLSIPTRRLTINEYPGGFPAMLLEQPDPTLFTGLPLRWCISPITGNIRFDFTPTANEAGTVYNVFGIQRQYVTNPTDLFPFSDSVTDGLVSPVAMKWRKERQKGDFDREEYYRGLGDAMRWATRASPREHWGFGKRTWR